MAIKKHWWFWVALLIGLALVSVPISEFASGFISEATGMEVKFHFAWGVVGWCFADLYCAAKREL